MKKKFSIFLVIALLLNFGWAKAEVSQTTLDYLTNQTQNQWLTMALAANDQANPDLGYLADFEANSANDFAKTILALTAVGQNPYNYGGSDFVAGLENYYTAGQFGSADLLSDDFWAIMALRSAGAAVNDQMIVSSHNFILDNQNPDGGFSYAAGAESDSNDTAAAVLALLDAGLTAQSDVVIEALDYLEDVQNPDGGFPFVAGSESDSGSDAWVIIALNKAGLNPESWSQGGQTPLTHLQTLALEDGSYRWLIGDPSGSPLMTAYAAVALAGAYYPVGYYEAPAENAGSYRLRIEGAEETYCDTMVAAATALEIVENGAQICGYDYLIESTGFGPYLTAIGDDQAEGLNGWLYRVNYQSPAVGAADYQLAAGDEVLWYYGEWGIQPLRVSLSDDQIEPAAAVTVNVEYFNEGQWLPAENVSVHVGDSVQLSNNFGQVSLNPADVGVYEVYAVGENFIISERLNLLVAGNNAAVVNMIVNIDPNGAAPDGSISFSVETTELDFGSLGPGQNQVTPVSITNNGNGSMYLEAIVSGDDLFEDNTYVDDSLWEEYQTVFDGNESRDLSVLLSVPQNFAGSGIRQGSLTFWASSQ